MKAIGITLVILSTLLAVCHSECNFPARWGSGHWMLHKIFPVNNTRSLLTYKTEYAVTSSSSAPDSELSRFTCEEFEISDNNAYYVKRIISDPDPERRFCVQDIQTANVILHKEILHNTSLGVATISACETALSQIDIYDVLLAVAPLTDIGGPTFDIPVSVDYPLQTIAYRVTYTPPGGETQCVDDVNSVLVVSQGLISILTCKYKNYYFLPLTGLIRSISHIDPVNMGEADDRNGKILIVDWHSKSLPHNRTYCVRYKTFDNQDVKMSFDLTSGDPDTNIQCMKGQRYDSQGIVEGRKYFAMSMHYDTQLVSRQTIPTTQRITTRGSAGSSSEMPSTTLRPTQTSSHVQLTLAHDYEPLGDDNTLANDVISGVSDTMKVDKSRISNVKITQGKNGSAVVTFDLEDGSPSIIIAVKTFQDIVDVGFYAVISQSQAIGVKAHSVYTWRDDDKCPASDCENGGKCSVMQGDKTCDCASAYTGPYCVDKFVPQGSTDNKQTTTYIIVGVIVGAILVIAGIVILVYLVRRKRNKDPEEDDSETGYNNDISMEARDREIYSTINKQPKAFHEKSFSSLDKNSDYGERTGIHL